MSQAERRSLIGTTTRLPSRESKPVPSSTQSQSAVESYGPMALAILGCVALTLVRLSSAWVPAGVLAQVASVLVCVAWLERRARRATHWKHRRNLLAISITVVLIATAFWQWLVDAVTGQGEAFEVLLLTLLQQTTLLLAAFRSWSLASRTSVVASGFLVIFTAAIDGRGVVMAMTLLYVFGAAWWLMADYWQSIAPGLSASHSKHRQPLRWPLILIVAGVSLVALRALPREAFYTIQGFMPTSGGDSWGDASARNGVGEGELLVAGTTSASTFGPVDSELFLESTEPTLYDVFSDLYGKPKPKRSFERAISLSNESLIENHRQISESSQASNGFSTVRDQNRKVDTSDRRVPENEVLQVAGTVPTHLTLETFDRFDGLDWSKSVTTSPTQVTPQLVYHLTDPWMQASRYAPRPWLVPGRSYQLRVFHFSSNRIPSPPHLRAWNVDHLSQTNFFARQSDGVWAFADREKIPSLTVIHARAGAHRPWGLMQESFDSSEVTSTVDCVYSERVKRTARLWTRGTERGWEQIQSLIEGLRTEIQIDPSFEVPDEVEDSGGWALEQKRATDFLAATLACQMLESLDYRARLVTGFYVRPENFDSKLGFAHVYRHDAHVWCEVQTASGDWVPLEPSAGYADTATLWTLGDRLRWFQQIALRLLCEHWPIWIAIVALLGLLGEFRISIIDRCVDGFFRWRLMVDADVSASRVLWLLEVRSRLAGTPRPKSAPLLRWYKPLTGQDPQFDSAWQRLQREWYSPPSKTAQSTAFAFGSTESRERKQLVREILSLGRRALSERTRNASSSLARACLLSRSSFERLSSDKTRVVVGAEQPSDLSLLESAS